MELVNNIIFVVIFLGMLVVSTKLILDSNFEKIFKQGRINSIRVAYIIIIFLVSFLVAWCFRELVATIYSLLSN